MTELRTRPISPSKFDFLQRGGVADLPRDDAEAAAASAAMASAGLNANQNPYVNSALGEGQAPPTLQYGPYLRYSNYNPLNRQYSVSVLTVIHQMRSPQPPRLKFRDVDVTR